ncbi:MAG: hypothetical protein IK004_04580 [Bacteroidales bacterium]|nr:hypothetical protein [Bacteroidales bacterium]
MLVERTFSVIDNPAGDTGICWDCPINEVCIKFINRQNGEILEDRVEAFSLHTCDYLAIDFVKITAKKASICCKAFPKYRIKETTPKEIHRIVGKGGNTIVESESFLGMIGQYFLVAIGSALIIALIGLIFSGIGSLF